MGKLVGILMVLLIGGIGVGLFMAPGWMAAQIVAVFGIPAPGDKAIEPRLKAVVMEALVRAGAPCSGIHRLESARQDGYDALLVAVCLNGPAYDLRFKPTGEIIFRPLR